MVPHGGIFNCSQSSGSDLQLGTHLSNLWAGADYTGTCLVPTSVETGKVPLAPLPPLPPPTLPESLAQDLLNNGDRRLLGTLTSPSQDARGLALCPMARGGVGWGFLFSPGRLGAQAPGRSYPRATFPCS